MKKILIALYIGISGVILFQSADFVQADNYFVEKVPVEIFERDDCRRCQDEKVFFEKLNSRRDDFNVRFHDIGDPEHYEYWRQLTELENLPKVTPITLVGNVIIEGFDSAATTGKKIEQLLDKSVGKNTLNFEEFIKAGGSGNVERVTNATCEADADVCEVSYEPLLVTVPLFGTLDLRAYSLPVFSIILGFIDGFNPCAMWVLVTFLIVLAEVEDRRKMWQIAGLFIFAEAIMYYLILNVWFTAWDFVGLDYIVTPIIGVVAMGGGLFFLYEWKTSGDECKVTNIQQRSRTSKKISALVDAELTILTILAIILLAFSVNIIEFACSIGIPQAFTKILEINVLSGFYNQLYISLYILLYMIDDLIVFGIALYAFEKIGFTTKYSKFANLTGGILMIILGLILFIEPDLLIF